MTLAGSETALLDEVRRRYDGRVVTAHDFDGFSTTGLDIFDGRLP